MGVYSTHYALRKAWDCVWGKTFVPGLFTLASAAYFHVAALTFEKRPIIFLHDVAVTYQADNDTLLFR